MSVPEVCSHEIVCVEDSVAPVAAGEECAADVGVQFDVQRDCCK